MSESTLTIIGPGIVDFDPAVQRRLHESNPALHDAELFVKVDDEIMQVTGLEVQWKDGEIESAELTVVRGHGDAA